MTNDDIAREAAEEHLLERILFAIVRERKAEISVSFIQRRFRLGYVRAIGLVDDLAKMGVVEARDPTTGTRALAVLLTRATAQKDEEIDALKAEVTRSHQIIKQIGTQLQQQPNL